MTHDQGVTVERTAATGTQPDRTTYRTRTAFMSRLAGAYRDEVSWGAIWGGLLTAVGLFILLSMLATAIGITTVQAIQGDAADVNRIAGVVSAVLALICFFIGGFVAGNGGGAARHDAGALNGFLVWALALVLMLVLAAFGLGQVFGALTQGFDQLRLIGTGRIDPAAIADTLETTAWLTFISLALSAIAATLGGWVGAASDDESEAPAQ